MIIEEAPHSVLKRSLSTWTLKKKPLWFHSLFNLDQQLLDLSLESQNLRLEVRSFVSGDRASNNGTGNTAGTTKSSLGGNKDVRHVLVFAQKRQVKKNFNGLSVSCKKMRRMGMSMKNRINEQW